VLSADSVLFVGDTHANTTWLRKTVLPRAAELEVDAIFQLGDFGYWPIRGNKFLEVAANARKTHGVDVWFIDGNHDDHVSLRKDYLKTFVGTDERFPAELSPGFFYLPRGSRVEVAGLSVACMGGAHSIDRAFRTPGEDWFPEEQITEEDVEAALKNPRADILVTHDAPAGWEIPGLMPRSSLPREWQKELPACEAHREKLAEVLNIVQPKVLVHGHYHVGYSKTVDMPWGALDVSGLNCEFTARWGMVIYKREDGFDLVWENDL
jgi:Icc-related predicted phosphoesterase